MKKKVVLCTSAPLDPTGSWAGIAEELLQEAGFVVQKVAKPDDIYAALEDDTRGIVLLSESYINYAQGYAEDYPNLVVVVIAGGVYANLRVFGKTTLKIRELVSVFS